VKTPRSVFCRRKTREQNAVVGERGEGNNMTAAGQPAVPGDWETQGVARRTAALRLSTGKNQ